ncbi:PIN domain-containing protein [Streptomyces sp. NPDC058471]|uniref:PIN domain-containing protein n=1 Tax=Streptomyces sp. NPDC058471 TaxID=3346516 RepID=UPI0036479EEB
MTAYVLDSSAMLAWLFSEEGESTVDAALGEGILSTVNLTEVVRRAAQRDYQRIGTLAEELGAIGVTLDARLTPGVAQRAAELIHLSTGEKWDLAVTETYADLGRSRPGGQQRLALGDGICLALAEAHERTALTADIPWKAAEKVWGIPVELIR